MGSIRQGAKAMGLEVRWRFAFVAPGSVVQPTLDAVYLDAGSKLTAGILDQHQDGALADCTAELVARYPAYVYDHLMLDWLRRERDGVNLKGRNWAPVLVTHRAPDFDALVASYLCMRLVEDGELPSHAKALVEYTALVDQGRYRVDLARPETATHAIHMAYLTIQSLPAPKGSDRNEWCLRQGLTLLGVALEQVAAARAAAGSRGLWAGTGLLPGEPGVGGWREHPDFVAVAEALDGDRAVFEQDREGAFVGSLALPGADGGPPLDKVPALVLRRPSKSKLNKYWARAEGHAYFVCPYEKAGEAQRTPVDGEARFARVILSLDPNWRDPASGRKPTLRGLGYRLELAEARWRREREGGDCRGRVPRWDDGACDNSDPWYDGRGHDHTIVDSPAGGTFLPYARVEAIATSPFWKVPVQQLSLSLIEPLDTAPASSNLRSVEPFPEMAATLRPFVAGCRSAELPSAELPTPRGCTCVGQTLRTFPARTAAPVRVRTYSLAAEQECYLEDLIVWVRQCRAERGGRLYVCASLSVGSHSALPDYVDSLLRELGGGELLDAGAPEGFGELVLFNSRTILGRPRGPVPSLGPRGGYLDLLLYAVFLHESLTTFSGRIADAIGSRHRSACATRLAADFLRFQTRFYQQEVTTDPWQRRLYNKIVEGLLIRDHYAEVQSELDRLAGAAERESASKMEWLLFFITLVGIVSTILGFPADGKAWSKLVGSPLPWSALAAVTVLTVLFWRVKRGPRGGEGGGKAGEGDRP